MDLRLSYLTYWKTLFGRIVYPLSLVIYVLEWVIGAVIRLFKLQPCVQKVFHVKSIEEVEEYFIKSTPGVDIDDRWVEFTTKSGNWSMHYAIARKSGDNTPKPKLAMWPGHTAGAYSWVPCLPYLVQQFDIYILDMPGWGRSKHPVLLEKVQGDDYVELIVEALDGWREAVGLTRFHLCAHSFAGFLALFYAKRYPEYIERLVMVAPGGLLPISSRYSYRLAVLFCLTPQAMAQSIFSLVRYFLLKYAVSKQKTLPPGFHLYYYHNLSSRTCISDIQCARFIVFPTWTSALWIHPTLSHVLDLKVPLSVIWGDRDFTICPKAGYLLADVVPNVSLFVIKGGSHNPSHSHPKLFSDAVFQSLESPPLLPTVSPNPLSKTYYTPSGRFVALPDDTGLSTETEENSPGYDWFGEANVKHLIGVPGSKKTDDNMEQIINRVKTEISKYPHYKELIETQRGRVYELSS